MSNLEELLKGLTPQEVGELGRTLGLRKEIALTVQTPSFTDNEQHTFGYALAVGQANKDVAWFVIADGTIRPALTPDGFPCGIKATASVTQTAEYFQVLAAYIIAKPTDAMIEEQAKLKHFVRKTVGHDGYLRQDLRDLQSTGLNVQDGNIILDAFFPYLHAMTTKIFKDEKGDLENQKERAKQLDLKPEITYKRGVRILGGIIIKDTLYYLSVGDMVLLSLTDATVPSKITNYGGTQNPGDLLENYFGCERFVTDYNPFGKLQLTPGKVYLAGNRAVDLSLKDEDTRLFERCNTSAQLTAGTRLLYDTLVKRKSDEHGKLVDKPALVAFSIL